MKPNQLITLLSILLCAFHGFSQDYVYPTEDIEKVKIISRVSVILKTHNAPNFLISSTENKPVSKKSIGLKSTFGKDNTGFNVFVEENEGTLRVESFQPRISEDLIVYLPKTMKVYVENLINNDISISGFTNEIEAKVYNGDVKIENVNGPVIVENVKGQTEIIFNNVNQSSPMSIINSHGDVDITLPSDTNADLEVSVPRGDLYTDFDLATNENDSNNNDRRTSSRYIKSKLNEGGVSISILCSMGNVYLRKQ